MKTTNQQLQEDVDFLIDRSQRASEFSFSEEGRDTGMSSNSIVSIAYGTLKPSSQIMPADSSDMASCERMWKKLPGHRKTSAAIKAMNEARNCNYYGKPKTK